MPGYWEFGTSRGRRDHLLIGIPVNRPWEPEFALNLLTAWKPSSWGARTWRGIPIDVARNTLVKDAQRSGASHIFFWDSDILIPNNSLQVLYGMRAPITSGLYWSKKAGYCCWGLSPDKGSLVPYRNIPTQTILQVASVGMGCCLIDMRVFDIVPEPWFVWEINDPVQKIPGRFSEDVAFCNLARQWGFPIFVHTAVRTQHLHTVPMDPEGKTTHIEGQEAPP